MSGSNDVVGDSGGFEYAQEQMNELDAASKRMHSDIASGQFTIEPDAARKAATACRDQIARIDTLLDEVAPLGDPVNFGKCGVGGSLSDKFAKKATGSDSSLEGLLTKSKQVLEDMAKNYDDAANSYEQTDADNAFSYRAE
jgi:uncharacterized protein YukE